MINTYAILAIVIGACTTTGISLKCYLYNEPDQRMVIRNNEIQSGSHNENRDWSMSNDYTDSSIQSSPNISDIIAEVIDRHSNENKDSNIDTEIDISVHVKTSHHDRNII